MSTTVEIATQRLQKCMYTEEKKIKKCTDLVIEVISSLLSWKVFLKQGSAVTLYDSGDEVHNTTLTSDEKDRSTSLDFRVKKQFPAQQLYYLIPG